MAGRGISGFLTGRRAAPDMREFGLRVEVDEDVVSFGREVEEGFEGIRAEVAGGWRAERLFEDFDRLTAGERVGAAMAETGRSAFRFFLAAKIASRTEVLDCARLVVEARSPPSWGEAAGAFGLWESLSRAVFAFSSSVFLMISAFSGQDLAKVQ